LVLVEVALAVMLLSASGLTAKGLTSRAATPPGFDSANLATARVSLPSARYPTHGHLTQFHREVLQRLGAQPGVESVALSTSIPMGGGAPPPYEIRIEGRGAFDLPTGLGFHAVSPSYFSTMSIPVLRGRAFNELDQLESRPVMLISQSAATKFFPGEDPIGRRIDWGFNEGEWRHVYREIVGVVADVRSRGLHEPGGSDGYIPLAQNPDNLPVTVIARSSRAESLLRKLPEVVEGIDPSQDVANLAMMEELIADSLKSERHLVILLAAFGVAALALAVFGVFGVVAYTAAQRTRELGIRMALGSTPEAVVWLVMKPGFVLLASGVCIGLAGAFLVGRLLAGQVPELATVDWFVYAAIPVALAFAGVVGCAIPALRAATMPPSEALRHA
jgi:predicted permease